MSDPALARPPFLRRHAASLVGGSAEDRPSGRFATFRDPDGNYLQLIQLSQAPG